MKKHEYICIHNAIITFLYLQQIMLCSDNKENTDGSICIEYRKKTHSRSYRTGFQSIMKFILKNRARGKYFCETN